MALSADTRNRLSYALTQPAAASEIADAIDSAVAGVGLHGSGPPTSGTSGTGAGIAPSGSPYTDDTNHFVYLNIGSLASPTWAPVQLGDSV